MTMYICKDLIEFSKKINISVVRKNILKGKKIYTFVD